MATVDKLARAFSLSGKERKDEYKFGTVSGLVDTDSVYVRLSNNAVTRCTCLYNAKVGDRVQVCIKSDGKAVVIGPIGNDRQEQKVLWSGASQLAATDAEVTFSEPISEQQNGVVFVFCKFENDRPVNDNYLMTFFPKSALEMPSEKNDNRIELICNLTKANFFSIGTKLLFVSNTGVIGASYNTDKGTNNGVTYNNTAFVLCRVIGV